MWQYIEHVRALSLIPHGSGRRSVDFIYDGTIDDEHTCDDFIYLYIERHVCSDSFSRIMRRSLEALDKSSRLGRVVRKYW